MSQRQTTDAALIRAFDLACSAIGIASLCLVIVAVLLVSWISFRAFPVYVSPRLGRGGVVYRHKKIRSMINGPSLGREFWEADRINAWGRVIRALHADELLELFHILDGTMSLVGPRPLLPAHARRFALSPVREKVPPGWAGLAQLQLFRRGILTGPQQARLDATYVHRRSLVYNLRILSAFFAAVLKGRKPRVLDPRANAYRRSYGQRLKD